MAYINCLTKMRQEEIQNMKNKIVMERRKAEAKERQLFHKNAQLEERMRVNEKETIEAIIRCI